MSLVWREQLSVGNDVIDSDHRHLIDIINLIELSVATKDKAGLAAGLDALFRYSQEHFVREERIAHAAGYEQVPHLGHSHAILLQELAQVIREVGEMGSEWSPEATERLVKLLRNWLIDHVIKEDLLMKPVLQKYSPTFDPR